MRAKKISKLLSQLYSAGLVIGNSKNKIGLADSKSKRATTFSWELISIPTNKVERRSAFFIKNTPPFRLRVVWVEKESP